jgi:molybdenum cofactor biosynthesis enzyme
VKLGDGQTRKGQVLEIAGKRAVVQVSFTFSAIVCCAQLARFGISNFV